MGGMDCNENRVAEGGGSIFDENRVEYSERGMVIVGWGLSKDEILETRVMICE